MLIYEKQKKQYVMVCEISDLLMKFSVRKHVQ
jgi:hypothetical protein